jgi:hypothetical protein
MANEVMCRICLGNHTDTSTDLGDFCSPCKCAGSIKYVHQECIKRWMATSQNSRDLTSCPQCRALYKLQRLPFFKNTGIFRFFKWGLALFLVIVLNVFIAWVLPWYIRCIHGGRMSQNNVFFINTNTLHALFLPPTMLDKINHLDFYTVSPERKEMSVENALDFTYFQIDSTLYRFDTSNGWFCKKNIRERDFSLSRNLKSIISRLVLKHLVGDAFSALLHPQAVPNRLREGSQIISADEARNVDDSTTIDNIDETVKVENLLRIASQEEGVQIWKVDSSKTKISEKIGRLSRISQLVDIDMCDVVFALWSLQSYQTFTLVASFIALADMDSLVTFYNPQTLLDNIHMISLKSVNNIYEDQLGVNEKDALFGVSHHSPGRKGSKQCVRLGKFDDWCAACLFGLLKVYLPHTFSAPIRCSSC